MTASFKTGGLLTRGDSGWQFIRAATLQQQRSEEPAMLSISARLKGGPSLVCLGNRLRAILCFTSKAGT